MDPADLNTAFTVTLEKKDCATCGHLRRVFRGLDDSISLDLFQEVFGGTSCSGHGPLFRFFQEWHPLKALLRDYGYLDEQNENKGAIDGSREKSKANYAELRLDSAFYTDLLSRAKSTDSAPVPVSIWFKPPRQSAALFGKDEGQILLARSQDEPQTPGYGRVLDPFWVDLDIAKRWKNQCLNQHGHECRNPFKIQHVSPAWLIDTVDNCLVRGASVFDYVALSYRWGASPSSAGFQTTRRSLEGLQKLGALSQDRCGTGLDISPTVRHAMGVVQAIDERYLWVDAICIVQDNEAHRAEQLQKMGGIYSSARLTIVASDGDATDGILGLKGISPPRNIHQDAIPVFENEKVIIRKQSILKNVPGGSPYFSRGWTYQEYYLSKRRLTFANNQLHWHCGLSDWQEDFTDSGEHTDVDAATVEDGCFSKLMGGWPDIFALETILGEYNSRQFSYPEDALPGITGLLSILRRSFEGGFLFGLPEAWFDLALTWHIAGRRRKDSGRTNSLALSSRLPSWSWVGWESLGKEMQWIGQDYEVNRSEYEWEVVPITNWYTHETSEAATKRLIRPNWLHLREKYKDPSVEVPEGWTREEYDADKHRDVMLECPFEGLSQYVYRHSTQPGQYFWLPLPIAPIREESIPPNPPQTPYISCQTRRGWFVANFSQDPQRRLIPTLLDSSKRECGYLLLPNTESFPSVPSEKSNNELLVELVAISRSFRKEDREEIRIYKERNGAALDKFCDYIEVLWVEWIDGVAYRKGAGRVETTKWERHGLEDVYLVLG